MKDNWNFNKEVIKIEYFPELDEINKGNNINKFLNLLWYIPIKIVFPYSAKFFRGYKKVRYFEFININNGKTKLIKEI